MAEHNEASGKQKHRAGLFDIRFIIAALIGVYGVILFIAAFFTTDAQRDKADGLNINLYAGIGMIAAAAVFTLWARLRPIAVPDEPVAETDQPRTH